MVTGGSEETLLRWIPLLPLAAAALHAVALVAVRRPVPQWAVGGLSCAAISAAFVVACVAFGRLVALPAEARILQDNLYTWIGAGIGNQAFGAEAAFALDPLSAVMVLVVTGVGAVIYFYSIGYMAGDERGDRGFQRFFCYLNLFSFAMLVLVLADNVVLMFLGWEGVGLCSYLLIGFWYSDRDNAYSGNKAFLLNRSGDFAFLVGVLLLFSALSEAGHPTVAFGEIEAHFESIAAATLRVPTWLPFGPEWRLVNVVGMCFFVGACGKSAQFPLHVWLPDATAGPTPVSALIHAATIVTAGVYAICRLSFVYAAAPETSAVIAWTGAFTAAFGAVIAIAQTDIKKVLAYSSMSQLGIMFVALGCGAFSAGMFHLVTHAFFKALLFLAAGSVFLAMHHEQDMNKMGGLRRRIPRTRWTFLIGTLAIAGFPPLSGFFSQGAILAAAYGSSVPGHRWLTGLVLATAGITAYYMFRLYFRIFRGKSRVPHDVRERMEDPPGNIIVPLYILSALAISAGIVGLPQVWGDLLGVEGSNSLGNFLGPMLAEVPAAAVEHPSEYRLGLAAVGAATLGMVLAWWFSMQRRAWSGLLRKKLGRTYRVLRGKFWVDEFYDAALVKPLLGLSHSVLYRGIDAGLIDGIAVNGLARGVRGFVAHGLKAVQTGFSQTYLLVMIVGAIAVATYLLRAVG